MAEVVGLRQPFAQGVQEILGEHVAVQIAKRSELHAFNGIPQRWVLERSFAWLDNNRRFFGRTARVVQSQLAVCLPGILDFAMQKIVDTFLLTVP